MKRKGKLSIAAVLAVLGGTAVYAQDKYLLKSPDGIAFSDFKGYEDWAVVSSARTDEVLKVIVANPTMIEAYKAGVPNNGQPFPDGSKIVKLQWKPKKSTEAPFVSGRARRLHAGFRHRKGQQAISKKRRMGIRAIQLRSCIRRVHGRSQPLRLRTRLPCGREGEGSYLPPVPEALNRTCPRHRRSPPPRVLGPAISHCATFHWSRFRLNPGDACESASLMRKWQLLSTKRPSPLRLHDSFNQTSCPRPASAAPRPEAEASRQ